MYRKNVCYDFSGNKADQNKCQLSTNNLFKSKGLVLIGDLVELVCETPIEKNCDSMNLVKSFGSQIVAATDNGKYVLILPSTKTAVSSGSSEDLSKASKLHSDFHGTDPGAIKQVNIDENPDFLVFYGHLKHIVYSVPNYSERRGTPFIHEAQDRGDHKPRASKKPIVCVSPNRDFAVIYGSQFYFGEKGLVG